MPAAMSATMPASSPTRGMVGLMGLVGVGMWAHVDHCLEKDKAKGVPNDSHPRSQDTALGPDNQAEIHPCAKAVGFYGRTSAASRPTIFGGGCHFGRSAAEVVRLVDQAPNRAGTRLLS